MVGMGCPSDAVILSVRNHVLRGRGALREESCTSDSPNEPTLDEPTPNDPTPNDTALA